MKRQANREQGNVLPPPVPADFLMSFDAFISLRADPLKMESLPAEPVKAGLCGSFEIVKRNVLIETDSLLSAANKQTVNN
jgi:hypothetical protein